MSEGIISLRPDAELDEFFQFMYGSEKGYAYSPLKDPGDAENWRTHFFQWPEQKPELIQHVLAHSPVAEVYFGPALYREPTYPVPENILGSNVLWVEFDGNSPKSGLLGDKIPHPTMRVRSSNEGHEHYYWHLDYFETDRTKIEQINRSLAYTLSADTSGWDSTQILRPIGTKNHKRDKVVRSLSVSSSKYSLEFFSALPVPKQLAKEALVLEEVPDVMSVIFKYPFSAEEALFFRKTEMATGTRSSALMRLAYLCAEKRMTDEEAYAILRNADDRWKKFTGRKDQDKRLLEMLNRARHKYPINPEIKVEGLQVFNWTELSELEIHVDWLIPGVLQRQGIMVIAGHPGVGKTQFTIQMLKHMALGKPFLGWENSEPRRVGFVSMEMGAAELKVFQEEMNKIHSPEELEVLGMNFQIVPIGQNLMFDQEADRKKIIQFIEEQRLEVVGFDSLSKTTLGSLEESKVKEVMDFADTLRIEHDCSVVFIHHNRKGQVGNKKPKNLEDLYGSFYITATATTVIGLWQNQQNYEIEISYLKLRLSKAPKAQIVVRTPSGLMFEEVKYISDNLAEHLSTMEPDNAGTDSTKFQSPLDGPKGKF